MIQNERMLLPYNPLAVGDLAGLDLDQAAGDFGVFFVPMKCEVIEAGALVTEVCAGSVTPELDMDLRPVAGSDSNRGVADIAHLILGTTATGKVVYDKVAKGTVLLPGQEIVVEIKVRPTGSATGHCRPFILVKPLDETKANLINMIETT
jgi:hypothetical protein